VKTEAGGKAAAAAAAADIEDMRKSYEKGTLSKVIIYFFLKKR